MFTLAQHIAHHAILGVGSGGGGGVGGAGVAGYVARWTPDGSTLGTGAAVDDGTAFGVYNSALTYKATFDMDLLSADATIQIPDAGGLVWINTLNTGIAGLGWDDPILQFVPTTTSGGGYKFWSGYGEVANFSMTQNAATGIISVLSSAAAVSGTSQWVFDKASGSYASPFVKINGTFQAGASTLTTVNGISITNGGSGALTVTGATSVSGANTGDACSDTAYGSGWDGITTVSPSKNAVYDKIETVVSSVPLAANPTGTIGTTAVNGSATTFLRSDGAPAFDMTITRNWTAGVHTFAVQDVHTLGIDLSTSGRINSQVANSGSNIGLTYKPSTAYTGSTFIHSFQNSIGDILLCAKADKTWEFNGSGTSGGYISVSGAIPSTVTFGIQFAPTNTGAGVSILGVVNAYSGGLFQASDSTGGTATGLIGGTFIGDGKLNLGYTEIWGGLFKGHHSNASATVTTMGGWKVIANTQPSHGNKPTTWYGGYVGNGSSATSSYGLYVEQQTGAGTNNIGAFFANATAGYKAICIRDTGAAIGSSAANRIDVIATDFLVNTTNLGFYNTAPAARPAAYTQTYATASRTHANPTATVLTDNTAGTANTTLEALTSGTIYATDVAAIRNNFADLAAAVNALIVDVANAKQVLNSVIDDDQTVGLKQ